MFTVTLTVLAVTALVYLHGWCGLWLGLAGTIRPWHAGSFLLGLLAIWWALASPVAAHDQHFLTVHMIQHLLLMSVAAPLILLGQPLLVLTNGLPSQLVHVVG